MQTTGSAVFCLYARLFIGWSLYRFLVMIMNISHSHNQRSNVCVCVPDQYKYAYNYTLPHIMPMFTRSTVQLTEHSRNIGRSIVAATKHTHSDKITKTDRLVGMTHPSSNTFGRFAKTATGTATPTPISRRRAWPGPKCFTQRSNAPTTNDLILSNSPAIPGAVYANQGQNALDSRGA